MGIVWYDGIWVILVCILMENIWIIYIGFVVIFIKKNNIENNKVG